MMEEVDVLISGATIITQNSKREIIPNGLIAIRGNTIVAISPVGKTDDIYYAKRYVDARGKFVFPGLINTHTHLFQNFMKGLGEGLTLYEWVKAVTVPSVINMTLRDGYLAAMLGALQAIRCGTTTVLDFLYALPGPELYLEVGRAFDESHLRGILGWGIIETGEKYGIPRTLIRPVEDILAELDYFSKSLKSELLTLCLAPAIPFGLTRKGISLVREYATLHDMLITMHINETNDDNLAMLDEHGQSVIPFLEEQGFFGSDVLAVHCILITSEEMDIFARHNVKVSHNAISNMWLGTGISPVLEMREKGIIVSLGTDGAASNNSQDMIEVMKCTGLIHKLEKLNPAAISSQDVLDMATIDGARAIGRENDIGSIEIGKKADLFVVNPLRSKSTPVLDPVASMVFSCGEESVEMTMVDGRIIMEDGVILTVDEPAILAECQDAALALSARAGTNKLIQNAK